MPQYMLLIYSEERNGEPDPAGTLGVRPIVEHQQP